MDSKIEHLEIKRLDLIIEQKDAALEQKEIEIEELKRLLQTLQNK